MFAIQNQERISFEKESKDMFVINRALFKGSDSFKSGKRITRGLFSSAYYTVY